MLLSCEFASIFNYGSFLIGGPFEIDANHRSHKRSPRRRLPGSSQMIKVVHHFVAINNVIHDMGGAGLNTCTADYNTW
jgi:hypothetical protein